MNPLLKRARMYAGLTPKAYEDGFGWEMSKHERKAWEAMLDWAEQVDEKLEKHKNSETKKGTST